MLRQKESLILLVLNYRLFVRNVYLKYDCEVFAGLIENLIRWTEKFHEGRGMSCVYMRVVMERIQNANHPRLPHSFLP
jgi:hypothetical protein